MLAQPSGILRASLPVDFAVTYMTPLIAEFARLYPGIVFDFDLTSRRIDLMSEPFDVAIRIGELENSQLIARPLAVLPVYLYASSRYLERSGEPAEPADLAHHECLGLMKTSEWTLHDGVHTTKVSIGSRFTLNSVRMICRLAALDMGIIMMLEKIVVDDLASGRLRRVLPQWHGTPVPVYAVTETRLLPAKTQYFIKFLQEHLSKV
ncbi:MAG: substrate binding domain-containing protein [Nitrosomonas ureae]